MNLTDKVKSKIDAMSYEQLLSRWRFDPLGSEFWKGPIGEYATKSFRVKKAAHLNPTMASKAVGLDNPPK